MGIDREAIRDLVEEIVTQVRSRDDGRAVTDSPYSGVFDDIYAAIYAADKAFAELSDTTVETRRRMVAAMRETILEHAERISRLAVEETRMGRVEDKVIKNRLAAERTPGVEDLEPFATTDDDGLVLTERAPYGVIGAITPSTNPTETIVNNSIGMIAAGNTVVFNPHPSAKHVSALTITLLNDAIQKTGGRKRHRDDEARDGPAARRDRWPGCRSGSFVDEQEGDRGGSRESARGRR
jgi:propionaldehyde dehydrogenase